MRIRTRILNEEQIRAMPIHNLKRYRKSVMITREKLHSNLHEWCCFVRKGCNTSVGVRKPTEDEVKTIKTFDWLAARCNEQYKIKQNEQKLLH